VTTAISATARHYIATDRWTSAVAFEDFKRERGVEYEALHAPCEAWTERETKIGTWKATT
jgi:hypothetical protein